MIRAVDYLADEDHVFETPYRYCCSLIKDSKVSLLLAYCLADLWRLAAKADCEAAANQHCRAKMLSRRRIMFMACRILILGPYDISSVISYIGCYSCCRYPCT